MKKVVRVTNPNKNQNVFHTGFSDWYPHFYSDIKLSLGVFTLDLILENLKFMVPKTCMYKNTLSQGQII